MLSRGDSPADVRCRFCGSGDTRPAGIIKGYPFIRCEACEYVFNPTADARSAVERSQDLDQLQSEGLPEVGWADTTFLESALALLPPQRLQILDFGTGQSVIPDVLRADGHRVVAVDVAPPLRPHEDRLTGDLLELPLPPGGFDLVFSFQVFEHLPEPRPILARLLELARPRGIVAIHTDMETEERGRGFEEWWYVLPPHHCSFYRHRTFGRALEGTPHRIAHADPKMVCIAVGED